MKLTRTVAYAIQATIELARSEPNRPVSCRELAERGNMPERFLIQILHSLVSKGVLQSAKGVTGGYYLARAPLEISLLEIVESFDDSRDDRMPDLPGLPAHVHQRMENTLTMVWEAARQEMKKVSLADLANRSSS